MSSPWRVLGLAPDSSLDEVRRAYARLLRQHRPDVDPVGFRRLRDAYEVAQRMIEARAAGFELEPDYDDDESPDGLAPGDVPSDDAAPPAPAASSPTWFVAPAAASPAPAPPRPRAFAAPLRAALARARQSQRHHTEARLLAVLARALRARPDELDLHQLVRDELGAASALRTHLQPDDVLGIADVDGATLTRALLLAHLAADDLPALWRAVRAIESATAAHDDLRHLWACVDAARVVALLDSDQAERLADLAFRRAPPQVRDHVGSLDVWIQAGKQLRGQAFAEDKQRLVLALCDPRVVPDAPLAKRAIAFALDTPKAPMLASLLLQRFPEAAARLEPQLAGATARANRRQRRRHGGEERRERHWPRFVFLFVLVASWSARGCHSTTPAPAAQERFDRWRDTYERARAKQAAGGEQPPKPDSRR